MSDCLTTQANGWDADSFRISLFAPPTHAWPTNGFLSDIFGRPLELEQNSKRGNFETRLQAIKHGDFQINAFSQAGRMDINLIVAQAPEHSDRAVVAVEEFREPLLMVAAKLPCFGPFDRIGVGASLIKVCSSKLDVYRSLADRFPCLGLNPEISDDFMLQMNPVAVDEVGKLNLLERWSYGRFERIDIPVMGQMTDLARVVSQLEGMKLDLDYNTRVPAALPLDETRTERVLGKLVDEIFVKAGREQ